MTGARVIRLVGKGLAFTLVGVLGLAALAFVVARTYWAGERVRNLALPKVNAAIAGRLELSELRFTGTRLDLGGIRLFDPEGREVASVERVVATIALWPLLHGAIEVRDVEIVRPRVKMLQEARGLNLARAIAARHPSPPEPPSPPGPPSRRPFDLGRLHVADAQVHYRDLRPGGGPRLELDELDATVQAHLRLGTTDGRAHLALTGRTIAPIFAPLSLTVDAQADEALRGEAGLHAAWGDTKIDLRGHAQGERDLVAELAELEVDPALGRAFAPSYPLAGSLRVSGRARRQGDRADLDLQVATGPTYVHVVGDGDLREPALRALRIEGRRIDLAALAPGAPRSRFDVDLDAAGGGHDAESAHGQARLEIPEGGVINGRPFGPVHLRASEARQKVRLEELLAKLPGVTLTGRGTADRAALALEAHVELANLAVAAKAFGAPPSLRLGGQGKIDLQITGSPRAPALIAHARIPSARFADNSVSGVTLDGRVPDLTVPIRADVKLAVASARAGGRTLRDVHLQLASAEGRAFRVDLKAAAPLPLTLSAAGRTSATADQIDLDRLGLSVPGARWNLVAPTRIVRGERGDLDIAPMELGAAPDQRMAIELRLQGTRIDGHVALAHLDLARLPAVAVPPKLHLAGRLDLDLSVHGRLPRPEANVHLALAEGRVGRFTNLGLALDARHEDGRVSGTLDARALGATHRAHFELPAAFPPPPNAPVRFDLSVGEIDLHQALDLAQSPAAKQVEGRAALTVAVSGRAEDPTLDLDVTTHGLRAAGEALGDVRFTVRDPQEGPLTARLDARVLGRESTLSFESPVILAHWLKRPPTQAELLSLPFHLRAALDRLPLGALAARSSVAPRLGGDASLNADLTGPAAAPHGAITLTATNVQSPHIPPTSGTLHVTFADLHPAGASAKNAPPPGISADLRVTRRYRQIADLHANLRLPVRQLLEPAAIGRAPLTVKAQIGPLDVQRVTLAEEPDQQGPLPLRGTVQATLAASGTLDAPQVDLRASASNARLGNSALGGGTVHLYYANAAPRLDVKVQTANGGQLALSGSAKADLSLPALRSGLKVREIPAEAELTARAVDLRFASGLSDSVHEVAGHLEAEAHLSGTIGTPQLAGRLDWKEGRLILSGFGEFRDIDLALRGDQHRMVLDHLTAKSGGGTARVTGQAERQGDGKRLTLEAKASLNRFRLYTEGQPLGGLSLNAHARGTIAPDKIEIASQIDEAHFEVAGGNRKDLQSLKRPGDVVMFENGRPRDRSQAKRFAALKRKANATAPPPAGEPAPANGGEATAADDGTEPATPVEDARPIRVTIDGERNLWVRGSDMNLELGLEPGFILIETDQPRAFGTVTVKRGFVEVFGRRFDLTSGSTVRFSGPLDQPIVTADATYRAQSVAVSVVVHVEGPVGALRFNLHSPEKPQYGDTDLMTLIVTGRTPEDGGSSNSTGGIDPGARAASLVGGVVAGQLQKALTTHLPIDVLSIEPGQTLGATRLEAGTYIRRDLYVAYVGRSGADPFLRENRNEVHLEYQLTPRWSFDATYGDARRGSADLMWSRNY